MAVLLLVVVYGFIMTEIIHRVSAALLGASLGIAALSILNMVSLQLVFLIEYSVLSQLTV